MLSPKVSVIIVSWNGANDLIKCLDVLLRDKYTNFTITVLNNGSSSSERELMEKYAISNPKIELIHNNTNAGFAKGFNQISEYVISKHNPVYLLIMDNDIIPNNALLITELVSTIDGHSNVGAVTAIIRNNNFPNDIQQSLHSHVNFWIGDVIGMDGYSRILNIRPNVDTLPVVFSVEQIGFWCLMISVECISRVGLLSDQYFFTWETVDYCERMRLAGLRILCNKHANAFHKWRTANRNDGRTEYYNPRNRFIFMKRYATKLQYVSFIVFFFCIHFWLAIGYYTMIIRKFNVLSSFIRGVKEGVMWKERT